MSVLMALYWIAGEPSLSMSRYGHSDPQLYSLSKI